ncbi:MAG: hypothetical protein MH204_05920 [Fimbriimonadaceae bacterium]|nr:hypothetical protein [Fimbriimonadaceae bacterium]
MGPHGRESKHDTSDVQVFEWILKPGRYRLTARHERAGVVRAELGGRDISRR